MSQNFTEVLDTEAPLDAEVLDPSAPVAAANVLTSPAYSDGLVLPIDQNFSTGTAVTWTDWDEALWADNGGLGGTALLPGSAEPETEFMLPYPGSQLKLLVAFGVLRLVDQGAISLDDVYDYAPQGPSTDCVGASSQPISSFFSQMINYSDNYATWALIKLLYDEDPVDPLNAEFRALGLGMLQLTGTDPQTGDIVLPGIGDFGSDVQPCNDQAEVTFAHKNGWTEINSSDAGIVESLPGETERNYIIAFTSNLGSRYIDADRPLAEAGEPPIQNTEKVGQFGAQIDQIMTTRAESEPPVLLDGANAARETEDGRPAVSAIPPDAALPKLGSAASGYRSASARPRLPGSAAPRPWPGCRVAASRCRCRRTPKPCRRHRSRPGPGSGPPPRHRQPVHRRRCPSAATPAAAASR